MNKCNACLRHEKKVWRANWRKNNPEASSRISAAYKIRLRLTDPVKARARDAYNDCHKRALKLQMPFDLTPQTVLAMMRETITCPYFGWALTHRSGKDNTLASIDRIDSRKGYTQDNVRVISYLANLMKSSATEQQLRTFAQGVLGVATMRTYEKVKGAEGNR